MISNPAYVTCGLEIYNHLLSDSPLRYVKPYHGKWETLRKERHEYEKLNSFRGYNKVYVDSNGGLQLGRFPPLAALVDRSDELAGLEKLNLVFDFKLNPRVLLVKSKAGDTLKAYLMTLETGAVTEIPAYDVPKRISK